MVHGSIVIKGLHPLLVSAIAIFAIVIDIQYKYTDSILSTRIPVSIYKPSVDLYCSDPERPAQRGRARGAQLELFLVQRRSRTRATLPPAGRRRRAQRWVVC